MAQYKSANYLLQNTHAAFDQLTLPDLRLPIPGSIVAKGVLQRLRQIKAIRCLRRIIISTRKPKELFVGV